MARKSKLDFLTYELLYQMNWVECKTLVEISKMYDVKVKALMYHGRKLNFIPKKGSKNIAKLKDLTYDIFYQLYYIENKSFKDIAKIYDTTPESVCFCAKKIGIQTKVRSKGKLEFLTYDMLKTMYCKNEMTLDEIGKYYGVSSGCIHWRAKVLGFMIENTNAKKSPIIKEKLKNLTYEEMYKLYHIEKKSLNDIGIMFSISYSFISKHLQKMGIILRDRKKDKSVFEITNNDIRKLQKYKFWRKTCFARDKKTCQLCGSCDNKIQFHVDHIIPLCYLIEKNNITTLSEADLCEELWDINNGRVLCLKCHKDTPTYGIKALNYKPFVENINLKIKNDI